MTSNESRVMGEERSRPRYSSIITHFSLFLVLFGAFFFWFGLVKDIPYYDDDFQFYFEPKPESSLHYFFNKNPRNDYVWRPLEATFLVLVQKKWDLNPRPVHVAAIIGHLLLALLVYFAFSKHCDQKTGIIASLIFIVHPAAVHPVASIDTLSQIYGVLFTCLAASTFLFFDKTKTRDFLGLLFVLIALVSKETSVCLFPVLFLGFLFAGKLSREKTILFAVLAIIGVYMISRAYLGFPSLKWGGTGRFGISLTHIPKNLLILWFAVFNPFSTLDIFTALKTRDLYFLSFIGAVFAAFLIPLIAVVNHHRSFIRTLGIYFVIGCAFLVPAVLFNHVSELYAYALLPLACGIIAMCFGKEFELPKWANTLRVFALILFLALSIHSVYTKTAAMLATGRRGEKLTAEVIQAVQSAPKGGTLLLKNPQCGVEYSVFSACGYNAINDSIEWIQDKSGRPDVKIKIVQDNQK